MNGWNRCKSEVSGASKKSYLVKLSRVQKKLQEWIPNLRKNKKTKAVCSQDLITIIQVYLRMFDHALVFLLFMHPIAILLITSYFLGNTRSIETKMRQKTY